MLYFIYRGNTAGFTAVRAMGLGIVTVWFLLSLINWFANDRFLDWLYSDESDD